MGRVMPIGIVRRLKETNNSRDVFATEKKRVQATERSKQWNEVQNKIHSCPYEGYFAGTRPSRRHFRNCLRSWRMWCGTLLEQNTALD